MAERPVFLIRSGKVVGIPYTFQWFPGFAVSQKQKSIESLHEAIRQSDGAAAPLEVSTKSRCDIGAKLSAFNLRLGGYTLENVFQSAKVFENGGPFSDLLEVPPKEAKRDPRLRASGPLRAFRYQGEAFPLTPKTVFYDYIYMQAVKESLPAEAAEAIRGYTHFTDIEFNPARSTNTQARAAALVKLLLEEKGCLPDFSAEAFIACHREHVE